MHHEVIHGSSMPQPMGHHSQAVRVGDFVFVAGQPGIDLGASSDPDTATAVPGGFEAEWRQTFRNLETVLKAAGSGLEHVVKTTTFLTDLANGEAANRLYAEYFPINPPARSSPIVKLPRGLLISIEAIAVVP
jgi:2-iminobutanoate/2-iminopropanoate deaminase